jgi:hypothetical protein
VEIGLLMASKQVRSRQSMPVEMRLTHPQPTVADLEKAGEVE